MPGLSFIGIARAVAAHLAARRAPAGEIAVEAEQLRHGARSAVPRPGFAFIPQGDYAAIVTTAIQASRACETAAIAQALAPVAGALAWHYHYAPRPDETDLADRIAFAEVIGPDGPLDAPACRMGFTLMAPHTLYPLHAHPAVELYLVISGHARWTTPSADRRVPPGGYVLHRANEPHAMQTFDTPLLALYGWSGAIHQPAVYL